LNCFQITGMGGYVSTKRKPPLTGTLKPMGAALKEVRRIPLLK